MLGGLARRVAFIDEMKAKDSSLVYVDSGRLFQDPRVHDDAETVRMNARLMARAYRRMGVHAVNVGDLELLQGVLFLRDQASQGLNLISANLVDPSTGDAIFPPYVIHTVDTLRIAFLGLLTSDVGPEITRALGNGAMVAEPVEQARLIVPRLKKEADIVIVLSCLGLEKERELIRKVPGIHFVMGGKEGRFFSKLLKEKDTFMAQSYWAGMYTGRLDLTLRDHVSPFRDAGEKLRIKTAIADLNRRLERIKNVLDEGKNSVLEFTLQKIVKKREQLEEKLESLERSPESGNLFRWQVVPLNDTYREDRDVVDWIRKAGFTENAHQ